MRNAKINQKGLFVVNYENTIPLVDENGDETGEKKVVYSCSQFFKANISGARGSTSNEVFGTDISYDKTISISVAQFKELKITENSVFFVDKCPEYDNEEPIYDYVVSKIAETLNEVVIALSKVRK